MLPGTFDIISKLSIEIVFYANSIPRLYFVPILTLRGTSTKPQPHNITEKASLVLVVPTFISFVSTHPGTHADRLVALQRTLASVIA